jgi:hypothetical protein
MNNEMLQLVNQVAYLLAMQGRNEQEAFALVMDQNRKNELKQVMEQGRRLQGECIGACAL